MVERKVQCPKPSEVLQRSRNRVVSARPFDLAVAFRLPAWLDRAAVVREVVGHKGEFPFPTGPKVGRHGGIIVAPESICPARIPRIGVFSVNVLSLSRQNRHFVRLCCIVLVCVL